MKEKFRQFMAGRYGTDGLNQFLSFTAIFFLLIALISRWGIFTLLGAAALVWCYFRMFSRNIPRRTEENYKFYTFRDRIKNKWRGLRRQWTDRKFYYYYRYPLCRQMLLVP